MTSQLRVWLARGFALAVLLLWLEASGSRTYEVCHPHAVLHGAQPPCVWFDGLYTALGNPSGGIDHLSDFAWLSNLVMLVGLAQMLMGAIPSLVVVLFAPILALIEAWPRTDYTFGYPITLAHGPGYWLWLTASALPLLLWAIGRCFVDRRRRDAYAHPR